MTSQWLSETDIPELFVNAKPGALITGPVWYLVRSWPNLFEVTVPGVHFVQEDSADPIGEAVAECYEGLETGKTMEVKDHNAIFVGGASGMCRATAEFFREKGGNLAILDRPRSDGAAVAAELGGTFHECNVMDWEGTEAAINAAVEALGSVHFCCNSAGGGIAKRTLTKDGPHPLEEFQRVIDLNLISAFNISRLVADKMSQNEPNEEGERGCIINTASIAAFEGQIGQVAYSAAKSGMVGMTFVMARDLGSMGIRANAIAPSLFNTGLTAGISDEFANALVKDAAFPKRMGMPRHYAIQAIAIYENAMMNGGTIRVDAGQRFAPR